MLDLAPAARQMRALVAEIPDDQLAAPTPCEGLAVGDLLDHVMGLSLAFRLAAEKETSPASGPPPAPSAANLPPDWREQLAGRLEALVSAWRDPAAWEGDSAVGGLELPAEQAGMVAVDELVLHGWDLARATGQSYEADPVSVEACHAFVAQIPRDDPKAREGLFGPVVEVPDDAPLFDRTLGLSGRDPSWTAR
ncbi:uncharacterized protein (TIGR03086 family) [Lipingzhangella halophila]|uniref:Uncharacterized protein (TIGR03086 family) n=1 Tax=Lipingzhangella halophila TaxID=1783352 RepID=A0A7W7RLK8_9ACTN|nr:TIGR03086 family metal-binding protein [Lipingzhangella halophila]MBB4933788.1 uncharacterized protein (TIGR03086 family) [Lipingzhangella halophila]